MYILIEKGIVGVDWEEVVFYYFEKSKSFSLLDVLLCFKGFNFNDLFVMFKEWEIMILDKIGYGKSVDMIG